MPSGRVSTVARFHVRSSLATTGPRRSPRPVTTTGTRRTRGRPAAACPAPAGRPARRPACSPTSCTRRPRRRTLACVPHSASATTRACGNAARSPLFTPGRPNHSSFSTVSATSRHDPVDRDQPPPRQPRPRRVDSPPTARRPGEQRLHRLGPQPLPGLEDRRLRRQPHRRRHPTPTTNRRSTTPARPHTSPRNATPSRSRSTPSPAPATTDAAARSDPPRRSPHRPTPAGTSASAPPPTPDPTTDAPTPASSTQHAASPQTTPL